MGPQSRPLQQANRLIFDRSKDYLQQEPLHRMNSRICFTTKDGLCNQFATPCSAEGKLFAPPWEAHHYLVLDLNAGIEAVPVPWSFCLGTFCSFKCLGQQITPKNKEHASHPRLAIPRHICLDSVFSVYSKVCLFLVSFIDPMFSCLGRVIVCLRWCFCCVGISKSALEIK